MRPVSEISGEQARALRGLLFDLDDTLLDHGRLSLEAYTSLFRMRASGLSLFAVTGRSAAWGQVVTRQWPLDGCITENGAIAFERPLAETVSLVDWVAPERGARRERLQLLVSQLRQRFPELYPADDVVGRITDFTFDIGETRRAEPELVNQAMALAKELGAHVHRSSVHLHVTYDDINKAQGILQLLERCEAAQHAGALPGASLGRAAPSSREAFARQYAYVGDSQNDESCFATFETTIGVANLKGQFAVPPRYQTPSAMGAGFVELADALCERRR